jgi:glyoxylase-like metal-dependent hydrolase (beta-lactamase superfamily II)
LKRFSLGSADVAIINTGDLRLSLKDMENVPEKEWGKYTPLLQNPALFPTQSILILSAGQNILVDPGNYELLRAYDDDFAAMVPPDYEPPPNLEAQMKELGKKPEDIDHVIITHAHYDHYTGVARANAAAFPKARYFLGRADWEDERIASAIRKKGSPESRSLGVIWNAGSLDLISERRSVNSEVEIIPSPGESPGHQLVRVSSKGQSLYCVGDLFHSPIEVENLTWMPPWSDAETCLKSRRVLIDAALRENALVAPSHMALGRIVPDSEASSGVKFLAD